VIPTGAYVSWNGKRLDGTGVDPESKIDWSYESALEGIDPQLNNGAQCLRRPFFASAPSISRQ
jgi:hypothetical protein